MKLLIIVSTISALLVGFYLCVFLGHPPKETSPTSLTKTMKLQILKDNYSGPFTVKVTSVSKDRVQEGILNYTLENGLKGQAYLEKGDSYYVEN